MRGDLGEREETDEVFLHLLEGGNEEDDGEWDDGSVLVCGGDVWYLLDDGSKEKEYICIF